MAFQKRNFLIALISPSGGGKTAILREVIKRNQNIEYSISYTTRPARHNEVNGRDYHFISQQKFDEMNDKKDFLEHAQVHDFWYGTSRSIIEEKLQAGHHIIMDIDVAGALQIKETDIDFVSIFILPPTEKELIKRLKARKTESDAVIKRRLQTAEEEMKQIHNFDYLIINDDFELAVKDVEKIIAAEENKVERYTNIHEDYYN
ncbi:MAG: guanylate kinase [Candidatus Cloacimonetes bacterium]|nr:guanylate kinase [Candidatus Cloacimonadota bacterium]MCF7813546.1 guanylate kinase [Candidatus Cloacimonadota bacterium]MCF7869287.1 guanylate kinase [Candidatus Cloacimonadota bacterium]MCF7884200.1 guanylate kinase [Candidatus Cloacimonadota bacterium]